MWGWVIDATPWPLYSRGIDPVPILQEAGWTPTPVWAGKENLATNWIRSQDRPTQSESLYQLSYPGPTGDYPSLFIRNQCPGPGHWHSLLGRDKSPSPQHPDRLRSLNSCPAGTGGRMIHQRLYWRHWQMSYTCRHSSCHTSPLTSDFLVLFTEMFLVTTFADDEHFRLDDLHQTGLVGNATVRRKKEAWNAALCIVLWTSFRGLSIIKKSLSAMLDNPEGSLPSSQELDIGPCSEPK